MAEYELHCFGESGHSYKAALMLELSGCSWSPVFLDFFNGETRSVEFREINEMGEAPVLRHAARTGEVVLTQSGVILDYLSTITGKFAAGSAIERREVLRWILWDNHKMSSQVGVLRFMLNYLPEEKRSDDVIAYLRGRVSGAYQVLEQHLATEDWLVGDKPTIADFSCCSYLYYPEPFGFDREDWPNISAWLDRIAALDGWKAPYDLMPRKA
ncbi:glutathione S-transferase family protein [Pontivivens nitratireducens]|uniref:Glutathione S-transferase family protein n=1 Tax=Pontivivens nitratireducens TaxID=2758038 RepID=A0A6G7VLM9_9RHOB|nr:glutathione S-transferase family protein [Pontibrevibacter nitratireducens]QIK40949.1 glutathione S-transferase family protein [Pontibrevibacter nitratireducens]